MEISTSRAQQETDMKTIHQALLAAAATVAMGLSATASAGDHRHHHRHGKHSHHQGHGHHHDRYAHRPYYAPPYVVVERPVYVAPAPVYYYPPVRHPGLVVSVDIPPIVIPLR